MNRDRKAAAFPFLDDELEALLTRLAQVYGERQGNLFTMEAIDRALMIAPAQEEDPWELLSECPDGAILDETGTRLIAARDFNAALKAELRRFVRPH